MKTENPSITILVDNEAGEGFIAEHGFSLWIETGTERIVFDTGQGVALQHNARLLGIDLARTDYLVLSHGHYDHTGGIPHVLANAAKAHVFCHPAAVQPRYSLHNGTPQPIQMPSAAMRAIDRLPESNLHWVCHPLRISECVGLTGPIPRTTSYEDSGGPFYLDPQARRADPIEDDQAMWIRTGNGLVVCVGCCHAGLVNTLHHILQLNPGFKIDTLIGGFHSLGADYRRLASTVKALRQLGVRQVIPCHCTGKHAVAALHDVLGQRVKPGAVGDVY
jgi:7,8-dihydropterin-6-yl-methyl-4-(beta-D-ribofuranosyl)aminobenzene 5'-phosphate synthase